MSSYFVLRPGLAPWGDYGAILWSGLCDVSDERRAKIMRTGPFVPPISFPFPTTVVTDVLRLEMTQEGFKALSFIPAEYEKVVKLDWHSWDASAPSPAKYPGGGEPENYILGRRHQPGLLAAMPALWAFDVAPTERLFAPEGTGIRADAWPLGADIARTGVSYLVSARLRAWMQERLAPWVSFSPVRSL